MGKETNALHKERDAATRLKVRKHNRAGVPGEVQPDGDKAGQSWLMGEETGGCQEGGRGAHGHGREI